MTVFRQSPRVRQKCCRIFGIDVPFIMRFSTKIFICIVGVTMLGLLLTSLSVYEVAKHLYQSQYTRLYQERVELVARNFVTLEDETLRVSLNAARLVRELESKSKLSREELTKLAPQLSVNEISFIAADGTFGNKEDGKAQDNLYSLCADYKGLIDGKKNYQQTPLIPDIRDLNTVAWFTLMPTADHKQLINVRDTFENFSKTLEQLTDDESDIVHVTLETPSGKVLGDVKSRTQSHVESTLTFTVPATITECCECRVRGFVGEATPYQYKFVAGLSNLSLKKAITTLKLKFLWIVSILMAFAFCLSIWLTKVLLRKITKIQKTVDDISESGDFTKRIPLVDLDSKDELDLLSGRFNRMFDRLHESQAVLIEAKKAEVKAQIAAQVAHDIRSPLTSMNLALNQLQQLVPNSGAEMFSMLSHAISRISGIVKRLSPKTGSTESNATEIEAPRLTLVDKVFFDVAQEHALKLPRTQKFIINGFSATPEVWSVIQVTEIQTAFSNILNNASEAMPMNGTTELSVEVVGKEFVVTISDNGKGIAPENLEKIFDRGISLEKEGGSGLGLYQAKKALEWSGGKVTIESTVNVGTKVRLALPVERTPAIMSLEVVLGPNQKLIVADDDPMILDTWKKKYPEALTFKNFTELESALPELGEVSNFVFVLDQYAGDRESFTGLVFIEKYNVQAFLSTTEFDDPLIQEKVKALKAKLIPKPQLAKVVVKVSNE